MARILLNGTVGSGKTELINVNNRHLSQESRMDNISLGEVFREMGSHSLVNLRDQQFTRAPSQYLDAVRLAAMESVKARLASLSGDVILDTPFFVPNSHNVPSPAVDFSNFREYNLDMMVTVVDAPDSIKNRLSTNPAGYFSGNKTIVSSFGIGDLLRGSFSHPDDLEREINRSTERIEELIAHDLLTKDVLEWTSHEVNAARQLASMYQGSNGSSIGRHVVVPREHSETSLIKLGRDNAETPVIYLAFPISNLGSQFDEAMASINSFRAKLQEFAVVISPLVMADTEKGKVAMNHTVSRDVDWFVRQADLVVAYFPVEAYSSGVTTEIFHNTMFGGQVVYVGDHAGKSDTSPFSRFSDRTYDSSKEFFDDLMDRKFQLRTERNLVTAKGSPRYSDLYKA
jgi:adenylate kinase